jgi:hypothetical protein
MPSQKIAGLRSQDDVDALIRCLIGRHDDEDLEKVAVLGLAAKGALSAFKWSMKHPLKAGGKAAVAGLFVVPAVGEAVRRGRSAAIKPTGYHPVSGYYLPQARVQ